MIVQRWAQNIRATFTTGSRNVVILGSLWESWVPGVGRRAGCRMRAPGTAYKRLRSHCHLCCQRAMNIWRRLTATTVNSSCGWDTTPSNTGEVGHCSGYKPRYNSTAVAKCKPSSTLSHRWLSPSTEAHFIHSKVLISSLKCLDFLGLWGLFFEELLILYLEDVVNLPSFCKFVGKMQLGSRKKFPRWISGKCIL